MNTTIYQNIATRTAGDIYIGVVGPVRTGKSTFIKRFMEKMCIRDRNQGREAFRRLGAVRKDLVRYVRKPLPEEIP